MSNMQISKGMLNKFVNGNNPGSTVNIVDKSIKFEEEHERLEQ